MKRALLLSVLFTTGAFTACSPAHRATTAPATTTATAAASTTAATAPPDESGPDGGPKRELGAADVVFEREVAEEEPEPDVYSSACGFAVNENFSYSGLLYRKARPFASTGALGQIRYGGFVADEGKLYARASLNTDDARLDAEVYLPEVGLSAVGPIVRAEYMQIQRTRIATRTSVRGAFFAPDVALPPNLKLKAPMREDYRIPCSFVSANIPENAVSSFGGAGTALSAPDKIVGLSLTPDGPAVAEIVHPDGLGLAVLGMYKTTALVAVEAQTEFSSVTLVGWIHEGSLDDTAGSIGHGHMGSIGHKPERKRIRCEGISVYASIDKKLHHLADITHESTLWGASAKNGDFRLDLGANKEWSPETPPKDGPKEPLDPFIPKEYLTRCTTPT